MENVENLVVALLVLVAVFICIQMATMVILLVAVRKMGRNLNRLQHLVEQQVKPAIIEVREVLGEAKDIVKSVRSAADNLIEATETVRRQVERVNSVVEETTDRARLQISRADEVVTDTIQKMEVAASLVQKSVLGSVRELSALIHGLSSGLNFLFGRKRNPVNEAHQDEEMFI